MNDHSSLKQLLNTKMEENKDYIFEFTQYFYRYGSVREQISFLNEACENILQTKILQERRERIESLIEAKKEKRAHVFSILGAVFTIAFSLIFSLETIDMIYKLVGYDGNLLFTYIIFNSTFIVLVTWLYRDFLAGLYQSIRSFFYFSILDLKLKFKSKSKLIMNSLTRKIEIYPILKDIKSRIFTKR